MATNLDAPKRATPDSDSWILAIDPGAAGGIARIWGSGQYECYPMPKGEKGIAELLQHILSQWGCHGVFIEKVWGRQGNAARSITTFMTHYGVLRGCVTLLSLGAKDGRELYDVLPTAWQRHVGAPVMSRDKAVKAYARKKEHKKALQDIATQNFPSVKVTLKTCDALLIAKYGCDKVWK